LDGRTALSETSITDYKLRIAEPATVRSGLVSFSLARKQSGGKPPHSILGYWTVTVRLTEVESPLALVAVTVTG
jgi:hypothetical protein